MLARARVRARARAIIWAGTSLVDLTTSLGTCAAHSIHHLFYYRIAGSLVRDGTRYLVRYGSGSSV